MDMQKISEQLEAIKALEQQREQALAEEKRFRKQADTLLKQINKEKRAIAKQINKFLPGTCSVTTVSAPTGARPTNSLNETILEILTQQESATIKEIQDRIIAAGFKTGSLGVALNKLVKDGTIERPQRGVYRKTADKGE
ncbi:MAG: hypothetical protein K9N49_05955 [Candidatus Marinimicrobia bacterium]|nr:hypothetical protein [Candidatus Neomarinimicrobiota bacterium]